MKSVFRLLFIPFFALGGLNLWAVQPKPIMQVAAYNLSSFTPQLSYKNLEVLSSVNSPSDYTNPDFGKVAPSVNPQWYEQYGKRTATTRSFVTEDGAVVSGVSYSPINYLDKNGNYVAINPRLSPSTDGWSALHQEFPAFLNPDGSTEISLSADDRMKFNFNNSIAGNIIASNNFTVGDDGMMIYNVVAGMNKRIIFQQNKIETDYLLNKPLTTLTGDLVISEEIVLPEGYSIKEKSIDALSGVQTNNEIIVLNADGKACAHFKMPVCYDSNKDKSKRAQSFCYGKYILRTNGGKNFLDIIIPSAWLNNPARIYPVTIDPVVTGPTAAWAGGVINSCYYPAFNPATIFCIIPANVTITNFFVSASYYANPFTFSYESDGLMYFTSACGRDPLDTLYYYTVQAPGGDVSGTAYLNEEDMGSTEAFCYSPSCNAQTLSLTMNLGRTYGDASCDADYIYYDPSSPYPFQAYIVGRSVEISGGVNSWTVSPASLCSNVCTLSLNATIDGGVPPYTMSHPWASSSITFGSHVANSGTSIGSGSLALTIPRCPAACGSVNGLSVPAPLIVDACGNIVSGVTAQSVTQNPAPVITPSPTSTTVCSGFPVNIINSSCVAGSAITWTGSNGSSGSGNIADTPVNNGSLSVIVNYTVYVSVNGCAGTPVIVPVTVNPLPVVAVSPPTASVCGRQSVSLTASGAESYSWSPSSGLSSPTEDTISANPSSSVTYTVTGTDENGCSNTATSTLTVNSSFVIDAGQDINICPNVSTQINVTGAPAGSTYIWTPTTNLTCNNCLNPTANPDSTTTYIVTATSPVGCIGQDTITVVVTPLSASAGQNDTTVCAGTIIQLNASGGTNYVWTPATNLSDPDIANPIAIPDTTTTYTVTVSSGSCSGTASVTISTFPPLPTPTINQSYDTLVCVATIQYTSYQWYFNSSPISGATTSIYIAAQSGNYNLAVHDENGCSISVGINIVINVGLNNLSSDNSISLYPNPAGSQLTIDGLRFTIGSAQCEIYNLLGEKVYSSQSEIRNPKSEISVDVSTLAPGIYFLQLQFAERANPSSGRQPEGKWLGRFVKE